MRDFTKVGQQGQQNVKPGASLEKSRRIMVNAIYGSALMFAAGGVWLLVVEQSIFPAEITPIMAFVFIVTAAMDVVAVAVMKKIWARDTRK